MDLPKRRINSFSHFLLRQRDHISLSNMNGTAIAASGFPGGVSMSWQIMRAGDVNGNGRADVIWRNTGSGTVAIWLMKGTAITSTGFPGSASNDWQIQ